MKHLLATGVALLALTSTVQAAYVYKLPLEVAGGGSLPNGTISFGTGGDVTPPVEPSEPAIEDPFEPVNPACDPWAVGYPGNSTGKDLTFGSWYSNKALGVEYRSCKLKPVSKPKLLARYASIIPSYVDECNPNSLKILNRLVKPACSIFGVGMLEFYYQVAGTDPSNYKYTQYNVQVTLKSSWPFTKDDIDRIEFDGIVCNNLSYFKHPMMGTLTNIVLCDASSLSYSQLRSVMDKQIMVEIYGK